ncbi:hypothetical protein Q8A73_007409 [Channa argus]|nr:hypothetical protein Q8A73_007409 [Channa argus]
MATSSNTWMVCRKRRRLLRLEDEEKMNQAPYVPGCISVICLCGRLTQSLVPQQWLASCCLIVLRIIFRTLRRTHCEIGKRKNRSEQRAESAAIRVRKIRELVLVVELLFQN